MEPKHIYPAFRGEQHTHFIAGRFFFKGSRDKGMIDFCDEVKRLMGNVVYDDDMKTVGEYLRQQARTINATHRSKYDIYIEPLKTITDNNGMKCDCYECTAANDRSIKQVCMVFLLPIDKQVHF